ncbi:LysR family transcriptional regulator [Bosea sp. 47.2.35]|jgi:LysR family nitrogen assimilation transcriptional regulator|uniref:LysR family transcriptional regulator n=1 Tax=Bosea sp. 47.2.35 TaxID=2969304 RepID=UPI0021505F5C|nr:LysR family transcriptional regulator [Bosea sp. 47.2.35]MCR4524194.1 LysR family transcriptional regulator [Bosea sp. 47.2.35]
MVSEVILGRLEMPSEAAINLRQLRYFVRIAEVGNITRAAEQLNVAQPALGLQIRQLEQELQTELLLRHSRGVVLTEAGKLLLERARKLLKEVEDLKREIGGVSGLEQEMLVLGLTPSIMLQIGPDMLLDAKQTIPNVSLSLVEELSYSLATSLERGELNYALAYGADEQRPNVDRRAILEEELLFVRPKTEENLPETLTLAEALTHELVQAGERDMVQQLLKRAADKYSLKLQITYEAQSIPAMRTVVVRGAAASFMPYGTAIEEIRTGKLVVQRISDVPLSRTLYLLKSTKDAPSRYQDAIDQFIDNIVERLLASLGPLARRVGR